MWKNVWQKWSFCPLGQSLHQLSLIGYKSKTGNCFGLTIFILSTHIYLGQTPRVKHIAIIECDLFFHHHNAKKISFCIFVMQNFLQNTEEKTIEFHLYCWDYFCKVNEWCLADCFYHEFKVNEWCLVDCFHHELLHCKMQKVLLLLQVFNGPLDLFFFFFCNSKYLLILLFMLIYVNTL